MNDYAHDCVDRWNYRRTKYKKSKLLMLLNPILEIHFFFKIINLIRKLDMIISWVIDTCVLISRKEIYIHIKNPYRRIKGYICIQTCKHFASIIRAKINVTINRNKTWSRFFWSQMSNEWNIIMERMTTWIHFILTHWGRDKMDAISQTTFSSAFSWMKMFEFQLKCDWSLFLRAQLTIFQHWFR